MHKQQQKTRNTRMAHGEDRRTKVIEIAAESRNQSNKDEGQEENNNDNNELEDWKKSAKWKHTV